MSDVVDIRRADERFPTDMGWLDSRHSFSFGPHHDPQNVGHGLLIVSNDDRVAPGAGFGAHPHSDMEIVTWVLEGSLRHRDSEGNEGVLHPGLAQRMSAGSGITHSEMNASETEAAHFVQMWVVPDEHGVEPSYEERDLSPSLAAGGLVAVASGRGHEGAISIHQRDAVMWVGRLADGETVEIPSAPFVHLFVARGSARIDDVQLSEGDAVRLTGADERQLISSGNTEVIIWESHREA
jgi:redox-sensitive bicupin YhaK (pirin superfamily)